jgi:hypothetical protein
MTTSAISMMVSILSISLTPSLNCAQLLRVITAPIIHPLRVKENSLYITLTLTLSLQGRGDGFLLRGASPLLNSPDAARCKGYVFQV